MRNFRSSTRLRLLVFLLLGVGLVAFDASAADSSVDEQFESDIRERRQRVAGFDCEFTERIRYSRRWLVRHPR